MVATAVNPFAKKTAAAPEEPEAVETPEETPAPAPKPRKPRVVATAPEPEDEELDAEETPAPPPPPPGAKRTNALPVIGNPTEDGPPPPAQMNPHGQAANQLPADFKIDLTDVKSGGGGANRYVKPGRHLAVCTAVSQGFSKKTNRMLTFTFRMVSGDYAGVERKLYAVLSPDALWKLDEVGRALGITNNDVRIPTIGDFETKSLDRVCICEFVKAPDYNGNPASDLGRVYPPDEAGIECGTTLTELESA